MEDIHGELGEVLVGNVPGRRSIEEIIIASGVGYRIWRPPKYPSAS
jgi:ornithine cyclodeaminase/alanine dehydrogenase-like protein (mu-crystallin family)